MKVAGYATTARAEMDVSVITASCVITAPSFVCLAAVVKTAPKSAKNAEKTVRSVTTIFVPTAVCATSARAEKDTSVITAICALIARSSV